MNTPLQQAAQAVIDRWDWPLWKDQPYTSVYIAELRKALEAEQAQAVEQEPVAWLVYVAEANNQYAVCDIDDQQLVDDCTNHNAEVTPLYFHPATPPTGQAQAGEPVAWMTKATGYLHSTRSHEKFEAGDTPLYLHPAPPPYDQQALELCPECGWKAIMPGDPCLNCGRGEVMKALDAYAAERDALASLDAQRLESLRALEAERNAALAQIETMTKDPSWFALKAERDALAADAGRYRWLRRSATKLSFDNALIGSLVRDQSELDGAMERSVTHKLNADRTAAVSLDAVWIPIDANTPRGVNMWLISKPAGVSQKGMYDPAETFFTHWFPNPRFED